MTLRILLPCVVMAPPSVVFADQSNRPRVIEERERNLLTQVRVYELMLEATQNARVTKKSKFSIRRGKILLEVPTEEIRQRQIEKINERLEQAEWNLHRFKISDLFLESGDYKVGARGYVQSAVRVKQVIDDKSFIGEIEGRDVWIDGVNTSKLTDDSRTRILSGIEIPSTKQFVTVTGASRTILYLRTCDLSQDAADALKEFNQQSQRTFTSADGQHEQVGFVEGADAEEVQIRTPDDRSIDVRIASLSPEDREYIKRWRGVRANIDSDAMEIIEEAKGELH